MLKPPSPRRLSLDLSTDLVRKGQSTLNMPSNNEFALEILVGGVAVPEYEKSGHFYIESNLYTQVSYKKEVSEVVGTEVESQVCTRVCLVCSLVLD